MVLDRSNSDFATIVPRIERFGKTAGLSSRMLRNVSLSFEELVFQGILPTQREQSLDPPVDVLIEHAEADDAVSMRLAWDGPRFNPLDEGDELSVAIVTHLTRQVHYSYEEGNALKLTF